MRMDKLAKTAKVALAAATFAIDRPYTYRVPDALAEKLVPGMRVLVPFGAGNRPSEGLVLSLADEVPEGRLKEIGTLLDPRPVLTQEGIRLALWMRERFFCTVYAAALTMLPTGLWYVLRESYAIAPGVDRETWEEKTARSPKAKQIMGLLYAAGGQADLDQIKAIPDLKDPRATLRELEKAGLITRQTQAKRKVGDKTEPIARLTMDPAEAMALLAPKQKTSPMGYRVTELLCRLGSASVKELCYFTGASRTTIKSLAKKGVLALEEKEVFRRAVPETGESTPLSTLNDQQQAAYQGLLDLMEEPAPQAALLYGVTGSGKTQVYLRLIQETLARGRTALVLVPEIALTPQLLRIFAAHFGGQIGVLHSSLRAGERYDEWKRIRRGEARVVIGTRSAVFAPLEQLGLVILDEEQEASYKSENNPRYHARDVAKYRCVQSGALLVMGSATPSVETMYSAQTGRCGLFTLKERFNRRALPQVQVVDMKEELRAGNGRAISRPLQQALEDTLVRGEQAILFLNRRGASRMVSCGECGAVPECPRCSVKLTYHSANGRLMCHYCGYSQPLPPACPDCGGKLNFIGVGTQKVQEELEELFPGTPVLRMDTDTVTAARSHEAILEEFRRGKAPFLVGTQMVAKGLDFENVTLVGVVLADQSLFVDDFRAGERTFSLLTQVVGRAGRGEKAGRALIQTFTPEHDVLRFSARQDYDSFYRTEIQLRRLRREPPFRDVFLITASGLNEGAVLRASVQFRQALEGALGQLDQEWQLLGPAPAAVAKINDRYRYRLTLTAQNSRALRQLLAALLRAAHQDRENRGVSLYADLNPY